MRQAYIKKSWLCDTSSQICEVPPFWSAEVLKKDIKNPDLFDRGLVRCFLNEISLISSGGFKPAVDRAAVDTDPLGE